QVAGTAPFTYQWLFSGSPISDATAASLNVTNVQTSSQGAYSVIVSNALGNSATSSPATLTLLTTPSTRIAEWDFNATNSLLASAPTSSLGSGTGALVNGTSGAFASGSFSDAAGAPGPANSGWNITSFPPQGTSNKTAGVQFNVT